MSLNLMYITNDPDIAIIAEKSGVNWIFVDLEVNGKEERQGHLDTVKSKHSIEDIYKIKEVLTTSELLVRVNPIYGGSKEEIDKVINAGADIIMLPFFKIADEVEDFISIVDNRAKVMLLLETPEAVENIDQILELNGIDFIHIGLNDLHLGYKMNFMFELLADGSVESLRDKILNKDIPFGFGGIAQLGSGALPAENIISEHYRLNSSMVILSRSFYNVEKTNTLNEVENIFISGVSKVRDYENSLLSKSEGYFISNQEKVADIVKEISAKIERV